MQIHENSSTCEQPGTAHVAIEKDNARFFRLSRQVILMFAVLIGIYLVASTYAILLDNPSYMHDWRGITSIALVTLIFLLYNMRFNVRAQRVSWPPPLRYSLSVWISMYALVLILTRINTSFAWDFYVVYSMSFGLFEKERLLIAVSCVALTLFGFQGWLSWPPTSEALVGIASQSLTIFSIAGFYILFQHLIRERFERNGLLSQLTQANAELEKAHRQLGQSVAQEQELAVLRERTRLAREMHDTIGHALVLISVKLEAAQRLRERDPRRCDQELESTKQIARETMTALRASIANLRSPALEQEGINLALKRAVQEFGQRNAIHVSYTFEAENNSFPEMIEETFWKVSQEALTNIEKHAQASHVQVCINQQGDTLMLSIHDDGRGLPPELIHSGQSGDFTAPGLRGHYGLRGIFERVEALGGQLTLRSDKDKGTTIDVALPLPEEFVKIHKTVQEPLA